MPRESGSSFTEFVIHSSHYSLAAAAEKQEWGMSLGDGMC